MTFYNIPWIIAYIEELVHMYKYSYEYINPGFLSWYNNSSSTCSFTIPHKTLAYTAETIQVLYFDFTKATVLVSLPLDLIILPAPALLGSFISNNSPPSHAMYHVYEYCADHYPRKVL